MKRTFYLLISLFTLLSASAFAQNTKSIYIPNEWRNRTDTLIWAETDANNQYTWSKSRSIESDNVIILWDKDYGSTPPNQLATTDFYYVDLNDLLAKCEAFYQLECSQLGFVDTSTSTISKYKIMVLMNHSTTWTCYGGGYDYMVPALWLNPATCKPVGAAVAHEVGHSFHYMCYAEASNHGTTSGVETGFHSSVGNGQCIWETTANWQALQSYPNEIFTESGTGDYFAKTHNYAFSHEWHRYQAYMFLFYLCEYYNDIKTVANVWNQSMTTVADFNQALMANKNLSVEELYKLHFLFALHCPTYDMEACKLYRNDYVGKFNYNYVNLGNSTYQVALASCPQATGFNVIPLQVPTAGTTVTTDFTALTPGCALQDDDPKQYINGDGTYTTSSQTTYNTVSNPSNRAFRLGYVFLLDDSTTTYAYNDQLYGTGTGEKTEQVSATVPENVQKMWLVVAPAPTSYYQHKWDESIDGDDMWPYRVHFTNTNISGVPTLDDRKLSDITVTYNLTFPATTDGDYSGTTVTVSNEVAAKVGTALQCSFSDLNSNWVTYSTKGPSAGQMMIYAAKEDGTLIESGSTANDPGHWFDASGNVTNWASGSSYVFSQYYPTSSTFDIGQFPSLCSLGDTYTIRQAFRYNNGTEEAKAYFVFNITIADETSASLVSIDYDEEAATGIYHVNENETYTPKSVQDVTVELTRTFIDGIWNTFVVPFSINHEELLSSFGENVEVATFTSYEADGQATFTTMDDASKIDANTPVIVKGAVAADNNVYTFTHRTLSNEDPVVTQGSMKFTGNYTPTADIYTSAEDRYVIGTDNYIYAASDQWTTSLKCTRAYIAAPSGTRVKIKVNDASTAIDAIAPDSVPTTSSLIYTLSGQRVNHISKGGIYIIDGKKAWVK